MGIAGDSEQSNFKNGSIATLSFDDYNIDNLQIIDLLDKYDIPATFYLDSAKAVYDSKYDNHEVGCHSKTHPYFHSLDISKWHDEIYSARCDLMNKFRQEIRCFAYPYNTFRPGMAEALQAYGFEYGRMYYEDIRLAFYTLNRYYFPISYRFVSLLEFENKSDIPYPFRCHIASHSYEIIPNISTFEYIITVLLSHGYEFITNYNFFVRSTVKENDS